MQERAQRHAPASVVSGGVIPMSDEVREKDCQEEGWGANGYGLGLGLSLATTESRLSYPNGG